MTTQQPTVIPGILSFQDIGSAALKPEAGMRGIALANGAFASIAPDGTQSSIGGGSSSLVLVETKTVVGSPQTTDMTFAGLNGDTDQHYILVGRGKNGSAGVLELSLLPNNLSTNQQGNDTFGGGGGGLSAASVANNMRLLQAAAGSFVYFEAVLEVARVAGLARQFDIPRYTAQKTGSNFYGFGTYWWDDSGAANMTSLVVKFTQAGQLDVGSYISLYKRTV